MRIATTVNKEGYIEKLPDGPYIIIFDTEKKDVEKYDNPGYTLKEGRRSAVVDFLIDKKTDTVVTIPEAFCSLSYSKAKKMGLKFIRLDETKPFESVIENFSSYLDNITGELPEKEIFKKR